MARRLLNLLGTSHFFLQITSVTFAGTLSLYLFSFFVNFVQVTPTSIEIKPFGKLVFPFFELMFKFVGATYTKLTKRERDEVLGIEMST